MAELQPADPRARRLALLLLALAFVVGALLLWALEAGQPAIARWLREDPGTVVARARWVLLGLAVVMAGPPVVIGLYLWRLGARVVSTARFPPIGTRMVQDTLVLTGDDARRRGRIWQGIGLALVLAGATMVVLLWRLAPA